MTKTKIEIENDYNEHYSKPECDNTFCPIPEMCKEEDECHDKKVKMTDFKKVKDMVLEKEKEGLVVLCGYDGTLREIKVEDLLKQPVEGILYDLNRDKATVLTFIEDPKWINDFAVGMVIRKLKEMIDDKD